jgi:hypothetical protein
MKKFSNKEMKIVKLKIYCELIIENLYANSKMQFMISEMEF